MDEVFPTKSAKIQLIISPLSYAVQLCDHWITWWLLFFDTYHTAAVSQFEFGLEMSPCGECDCIHQSTNNRKILCSKACKLCPTKMNIPKPVRYLQVVMTVGLK